MVEVLGKPLGIGVGEDVKVDDVTVEAGPTKVESHISVVETRSVPLLAAQSKALVDAQKARVAEFEAQTRELARVAKAVIVRDEETNKNAVEIGALASKTIKEIDARVKEIITPANTFVKEIRNFGKSLTDQLERARTEVGAKTANYRGIVEMERRKAEEAREKARLEVQKDINQQAQDLGMTEVPLVEKSVIKEQPVVTRTEYGTAYSRKKLKWRIINPLILPREYLMPNDRAIEDAVKAGVEVPGVQTYEEVSTVFRT